jgi:hypothetical protein
MTTADEYTFAAVAALIILAFGLLGAVMRSLRLLERERQRTHNLVGQRDRAPRNWSRSGAPERSARRTSSSGNPFRTRLTELSRALPRPTT